MHYNASVSIVKPRRKLRSCPYCGKRFRPKRDWQKFDSPTCRTLHWQARNPRIRLPA